MYCFVEREKMDEILTELNLAAAFQGEIIVPLIFQSMLSNEKIERLGVTAIGDRVRLLEVCKEEEENNSRSLFGSRSVGSPSTSRADAVLEERMCLFSSRGPRAQSKSTNVSCFSI